MLIQYDHLNPRHRYHSPHRHDFDPVVRAFLAERPFFVAGATGVPAAATAVAVRRAVPSFDPIEKGSFHSNSSSDPEWPFNSGPPIDPIEVALFFNVVPFGPADSTRFFGPPFDPLEVESFHSDLSGPV